MKVSRLLTSTSRRNFVLVPSIVAVEHTLSRRRTRRTGLLLMVWGYLQYLLAGEYRTRHGGGGPGMSRPPEQIVRTGIYGVIRNPMYLGHLIFLTGLTVATRSPIATAVLAGSVPWFDRRAAEDEARLEAQFGPAYAAYRDRVPRWLPGVR